MNTLNFEPAREQMIYHQIRPWDVNDDRVLDVLRQVPREAFVPPKYRELAFADTAIPLPAGQSMLKPIVEGRLLQAVLPQPDHRVLLIGTGSGFVAACLSHLCDHVTTLDIHRELSDAASARFADERIRNIEVQTVDFNRFDPGMTFHRILVTGSMPLFDKRLPEWLKDDGRLVLITGTSPDMHVEQVQRDGEHYTRTRLFETDVPALENVPRLNAFEF